MCYIPQICCSDEDSSTAPYSKPFILYYFTFMKNQGLKCNLLFTILKLTCRTVGLVDGVQEATWLRNKHMIKYMWCHTLCDVH